MSSDATIVAILRKSSTAAAAIAPMLPGPAAVVAGAIGAGLALAADIASIGSDPIAEIHRIRDTLPMLADVERGWNDRMLHKFGYAVAGDPIVGDDIYAELDAEARKP